MFFISFFSLTSVEAQDDANTDIWLNYKMDNYIKKHKLWFRNEADYRYTNNDNSSSIFMLRSRLKYMVTYIFDLRVGIDFRYNYLSINNNTFEIRPWQGVKLDWPSFGRFSFEHYYRFEQRIFYDLVSNESELGFRSRYKLILSFPLNNSSYINRTFFLDLSSEFFLPHDKNVQENFANNIRPSISLGFRYNNFWTYYLALMANNGKDNFDSNRTVNNIIISFSVKKIFSIKER